ncbi:uncharacterized protein LY89DRAFT_681104 [Mollisia scopiformis]|uniref:Uncharacterized protein n=1 Tax=Mollisia scopiformis TaxID=149040 RepID=A0A194XN24_MOLSC|nr:uncharacterized protein LY89DRAFT_681104 [Mollisia scopiformis]KUJ21665.1 hypothetical protein LY89DRAFT_681104 [Mollisia scopiformis]
MRYEIEKLPSQPARTAVSELVRFVRTHSPYYRSLYRDLPSHIANLEDLPLTNNDEYWEASNGETNEVITTPFIDGVVLRSGGSSSIPKTLLMTRAEWHLTAQINSVMMAEASELIPGDRVANLAVQGGLYSGFMTYGYAIMNCPVPIVNLPISGNEPLESITKSIIEFKATVIICSVYRSTRLAEHLQSQQVVLPNVRRILFAGEAFYKDLRDLHRAVFPNAEIRPLEYGSVELKILGFPINRPGNEKDADVDPIYRVNTSSAIMEIIDGNGSVIRENGRRGLVVGTNLIMRLQPKIRYPVGDSAEWVDYDAGLFRFCGRESVGLKIDNAHVTCQSIRKIVAAVLGGKMVAYQVVVSRSDKKTVVTIRIVAEKPEMSEEIRTRIEGGIMEITPAWRERRDEGRIAPLKLEWVAFKDLVQVESSGKLKEIVEKRYEES